MEENAFLYEDSDDRFAFIAGYTGGGVPYGITWEELGLEPYASYEEICRFAAVAGAILTADFIGREYNKNLFSYE